MSAPTATHHSLSGLADLGPFSSLELDRRMRRQRALASRRSHASGASARAAAAPPAMEGTMSFVRTWIGPLMWIVLLVLVAASEARSDVVVETLEVDAGGELIVDAPRGSVHVTGVDSEGEDAPQTLTIEVHRYGLPPHVHIDVEQDGDRVRVSGHRIPLLHWLPPFSWRRTTFEIQVPKQFDVQVETNGGNVEIHGVEGHVDANTSGGRLHFRDIDGTVAGHTRGGSVEVDGCSDDVVVRTSGGSIHLEDVDGDVVARTAGGRIHIFEAGGDVEASTAGGSIEVVRVAGEVQAQSGGGGIRARFTGEPAGELEAAGGDIHVWFPAEAGADVDARALGGSVVIEHTTDPDVWAEGSHHDEGRVRAEVGGGGEELRLRALGGSIRVREL